MTDPANQPVFLHFGNGHQTATLWMIKRVVVDGWSEEHGGAEATSIGLILYNPMVHAVEVCAGTTSPPIQRSRIAFMKRTLLLSFCAALAFAPFLLAQNRADSLKTFGAGSTIDATGAKIP